MLFAVKIETFLRPEGPAAHIKRANEFVDSAMLKQEMIRHLVIGAAICSTFRTDGFPLVRLQVMQQMKPKFVVHSNKLQATNAANWILDVGLPF